MPRILSSNAVKSILKQHSADAFFFLLKIDWAPEVAEWVADTAYEELDYVKPTSDNGFFSQAIIAGTSGGSEPTWPLTGLDSTVVDNTVTWQTVGPIRVVNNFEDIISGGFTFLAFDFEIHFPDGTEGRLPRITLRMQNVDLRLGKMIRTIQAATVAVQLIMEATPNTIEASFIVNLQQVRYDANQVEMDLGFDDFLSRRYPYQSFDPVNFPGLRSAI